MRGYVHSYFQWRKSTGPLDYRTWSTGPMDLVQRSGGPNPLVRWTTGPGHIHTVQVKIKFPFRIRRTLVVLS